MAERVSISTLKTRGAPNVCTGEWQIKLPYRREEEAPDLITPHTDASNSINF
jgi:hypothetical protein